MVIKRPEFFRTEKACGSGAMADAATAIEMDLSLYTDEELTRDPIDIEQVPLNPYFQNIKKRNLNMCEKGVPKNVSPKEFFI